MLERDGDVVWLLGRGPAGEFEVITGMVLAGTTLVLRGLHISGAGPRTIGLRELREFARLLGRTEGAHTVVVLGAPRTTGARPGHEPRPIRIEVD